MAKHPPASAPAQKSDPSFWLSYALVGLCGLSVGILGTYLVLRPALQRPAPAAVAADTGLDLPQAGDGGLPPAGMTAGMPPAQADRTLGNFYYDQRNWTQAIRYYESAIKQGSDDADIRTDLGNAYQFADQPGRALQEYLHAQQLNPQHEFSLYNQGALYLSGLRDPAKAKEIWQQYLARFPNGQNATLARQHLAEAGGAPTPVPTGTPSPAATPTAPVNPPAATPVPDSTESRLLKLVSPAKPAKP